MLFRNSCLLRLAKKLFTEVIIERSACAETIAIFAYGTLES